MLGAINDVLAPTLMILDNTFPLTFNNIFDKENLSYFTRIISRAETMEMGEYVLIRSQLDVQQRSGLDKRGSPNSVVGFVIIMSLGSAVLGWLGAIRADTAVAMEMGEYVSISSQLDVQQRSGLDERGSPNLRPGSSIFVIIVSLGLAVLGWLGAMLGRTPVFRSIIWYVIDGWIVIAITISYVMARGGGRLLSMYPPPLLQLNKPPKTGQDVLVQTQDASVDEEQQLDLHRHSDLDERGSPNLWATAFFLFADYLLGALPTTTPFRWFGEMLGRTPQWVLSGYRAIRKGDVVIMGDFNEVRKKAERFGSVFNVQGADAFNLFISNTSLEEVPLGGCSFTWCHKSATKMSKLDRFLISKSLMSVYPNISAITLDRYLSDHRLILMRESHYDYGPVSFRFFHYWFEMEGFDKFVEESWKEALVAETNALIKIMKKLKTNVVRSLQELEKFQSLEVAQKAKIKWAIEGDENSKYYHGILNKKRSRLAIRGILVDGNWIDSPGLVKSEFLSHFKNRFDQPQETRLHLDMNFPNNLNSDQQADLECEVTKKEIKRAVWDRGIDKPPGPDGWKFFFYYFDFETPDANMVKDFRPISLIGSMYKIIAKILVNRLVVVLGNLVNEVQSAFVADRQILDGPFILNELLQWCKSKKKHSLVFKVDFEKAGTVIVNESPTEEFQFYKGFKQGDPLSPFLFILFMESLHVSFQRVVDAGMFKCITLGSSLHLSHMFYADDAIFVGQWSESNISTIVHVLDCLNRASGLRINMSKSKLMGISVDADKVDQAARKIGCVTLKTPFIYLGSKVGGLMSRVQSWNETVEGMVARLSKWKMKTLSIRDPRGGEEQAQFDLMLEKVEGTSLVIMRDRWVWSLEGSGEFSIASVRRLIDDYMLPEVTSKTRWMKAVPIKVNVLA
ncbi:RNA-directed DNA polymerase, eukaryota, reverse transcriptase zinc-binding domain protein [Tanacetum coccineum]